MLDDDSGRALDALEAGCVLEDACEPDEDALEGEQAGINNNSDAAITLERMRCINDITPLSLVFFSSVSKVELYKSKLTKRIHRPTGQKPSIS